MLEAALLCLAMNVYYEARGEHPRGRVAVAQVTMARAKKPGNVCPTVYAAKQFAWTERKGVAPRDGKAWRSAVNIARRVLAGDLRDVTGGATHFHHVNARPRWAKKLTRVATIGEHIFYS